MLRIILALIMTVTAQTDALNALANVKRFKKFLDQQREKVERLEIEVNSERDLGALDAANEELALIKHRYRQSLGLYQDLRKNDKRVKHRFQLAIKTYRQSKKDVQKALQAHKTAAKELLALRK